MTPILEALVATTTGASTAMTSVTATVPMGRGVMGPAAESMIDAIAGSDVVAQLSTSSGTGLRDIVLAIIGTFTIVILAGRAAGALADERYGKLLWLVLGAIPVIGFAYFPDLTVSILKGLFTSGVG